MRNRARSVWGLAMGIGLAAASMAGQAAPQFGVDSMSVAVLDAWEMEMLGSADTWNTDPTTGYRYAVTSIGGLVGAMKLPHGARLISVELEGCDTSDTAGIGAILERRNGSAADFMAFVLSGVGETPGCDRFSLEVAEDLQEIDNETYRYVVRVGTGATTDETTFGAVRFYYRLQVSPAPPAATFNDVPTSDPAFAFVEALAASGITAGCGGGAYCPDAPLTRRQMAVFFAKALGLHFPVAGPAQ